MSWYYFQAGVADGGWGWGGAFLDFNNDGYQDIVMTNGRFTYKFTPNSFLDGSILVSNTLNIEIHYKVHLYVYSVATG
jgi:hypothetical protein